MFKFVASALVVSVALLAENTSLAQPSYTVIKIPTLGGDFATSDNVKNPLNENGQVIGRSRNASGELHAFFFDGTVTLQLDLGGSSGFARALNDAGQVVGGSENSSGERHAFFFDGTIIWQLNLPGATDGQAFDVNESGQVCGASGGRAFFYDGVTIQEIGLGGTQGEAALINEAGQVAGSARTATGREVPFLFDGVITQEIGLGGRGGNSFALNESGQVCGESGNLQNDSRAFLFDGAASIQLDLGVPSDCDGDFARDLNESGQVVGCGVKDDCVEYALFFDGAIVRELSLGGMSGNAEDINNCGQVVGGATDSNSNRLAFLFDGTLTQPLDLGGNSGEASAINDAGQVVGISDTTSGERHAFFFDPVDGIFDLNDFMPPSLSNWVLDRVWAINERGDILAYGDDTVGSQGRSGFLLLADNPRPRICDIFIRGDANGDGTVDRTDVVEILQVVFRGRTAGCEDALDVNDNGQVGLADALLLVSNIFLSTPPIPPPTVCGLDPTDDGLGCQESSCQ